MSKPGFPRNQQELYSSIIHDFAGIIVILDRQGKIMFINQQCERISGYPASEMVGKNFGEIFLNVDELELFKAFLENLQVTDFPFYHESTMLTKQGESRLVLWSYNIDKYTDDRIDSVFLIGLDITERGFKEEALRKRSENADGVINALPIAVISLDREGKIKSSNDRAERAFGWEPDLAPEIFRQSFPHIEENEFEKAFGEALGGKLLAAVKTCARMKDGRMADFHLYFSPWRDMDGGIIGVVLTLVDCQNS
ncbi:MAG: PAS domain S-box protein [Firmicutes bacterium]|nr:PAS domain S-box protein [Bacillota bacterium]